MIKTEEMERIINNYSHANGYPKNSLTAAFFLMAEKTGLTLPETTLKSYNSVASLCTAKEIGFEAVNLATTITTPKKLFSNKKTNIEIINSAVTEGIHPCGIIKYKKIYELFDTKLPFDFLIGKEKTDIVLVKGSAGSIGGYVKIVPDMPLSFTGSAWVYNGLEEAEDALSSNSIDAGVMIIRNCAEEDISIIPQIITAIGKQNNIAIATDGYCEATAVLTITNISPNGYINEEFANIQTNDIIEIDVSRGRFNTSVLSKDMKYRAKKNLIKQRDIYFE
jgi:dihydroxyacid dehydratase/phosphogluconate dehydratase